ncbi:MAG: hypothetical protein Q8Q30_00070 [Candidatus Woesebacteria bacterium]|nr:hypothetical protein [Candidatus Woesebacteria bacterium]
MKVDRQDINNEFDVFCAGHGIKGALKSLSFNVYQQTGDIGGVILKLREMGYSKIIEEEKDHTLALIEERDTLAKILPDPNRRARRRHQAMTMRKKMFGMGKERE